MENREKISVYEFYTNPKTGRIVCIEECSSMNKVYFVWYRDPDKKIILLLQNVAIIKKRFQ